MILPPVKEKKKDHSFDARIKDLAMARDGK